MPWTVVKKYIGTTSFTKETPFGELHCEIQETTRPDTFYFSMPEKPKEHDIYHLELYKEDPSYRFWNTSADLMVYNPSKEFLSLSREECLSWLKPHLDEITGGVELKDEVGTGQQEACTGLPCADCTCQDHESFPD
ncbi:hypothetical protein [Rossellomorea marisflavi]|uniref:hypothetical protein n=1 Tax=Rossellomorea marisflavi TaxID=189381 RepID=UPI003FA01C0B